VKIKILFYFQNSKIVKSEKTNKLRRVTTETIDVESVLDTQQIKIMKAIAHVRVYPQQKNGNLLADAVKYLNTLDVC